MTTRKLVPVMSLILFSFIPIWGEGRYYNGTLAVIHSIMAIICSISLFSFSNRPYSLFKVFHLFFFFFFCIAPIIQYKNGVIILDTKFDTIDYLTTSFTSLILLIIFNTVYYIYNKRYSKKIYKLSPVESRCSIHVLSNKKIILMLLVSSCICLYNFYLNGFNLNSLLIRGGEGKESLDYDSTMLIFSNALLPIPMILSVAALIKGVRNKFVISIFFLLFFFSTPFTGVSRFSAAALYIPVLLWCVPFFRKRDVFVLLMTFGLLVIFPFLNNFRYYNAHSDMSLSLDFSQFEDMNFDSYSMFMRVITGDIVTNGYQLLGVFFFWVPRAFWPTKPIGSGAFVAEETNLSFSNISMPLFGEGYVNFGYVGAVLFTIILGVALAKIDSYYWKRTVYLPQNISHVIYFMLLGLLMFILRGDMLSSIAYTTGYYIAFRIVRLITK